jgi:succinyl-diaminopimelate desuccinylase
MTLGIAEKGVLWLAIEAQAPSGQGMLARPGSSAITKLAEVIGKLDQMNSDQIMPPPELSCLSGTAGDERLRLSINAGIIAGGRFISQVATDCRCEIDIRVPPGLTIDEVEARVSRLMGDGLSCRRLKGWNPNWTSPGEPIVCAVADAAQAVRGTASPPVVRLPASDASRWRAHGIPAVCFGPQPELASGSDDYINERDLIDCTKIYALAALAYLNG